MLFTNDIITLFIPAWLLVIIGFVVAMLITYFSIPPIVSLARSRGLYDMPNGRTSHFQATPYLGGVAVFTGLILSTVIIAGVGFGKELAFIFAGLIILLFVGLKDDMLSINPYSKLAGQLIAAGIIVFLGNIRISNFHSLLTIEEIPYFESILFSIFVIIVIINGINLIDGIDGLASGIGIIISLSLGIWFFIADQTPFAVMSFSLSGSLIAFFYFNVFSTKNKIFLGDAGSLMIGITIAILIITFLESQLTASSYKLPPAPAVAFGILIVPLYDTLRVFILRISQGRSPFSADRQHIHHILIDLGYSHFAATSILMIFNVFFIVLSLSLLHIRNLYLILIHLSLASAFTYLAFELLRRKIRRRLLNPVKNHLGKQVSLLKTNSTDEYLEGEKNNIKKKILNFFTF